MKSLYLVLLSFSGIFLTDNKPSETTLNSSIEKVVVFQNSARVTRQSEPFVISTGTYVLKLEKVSPFLNKNSVELKLDGNGTIAQVKYRKNHLLSKQLNEQNAALVNESKTIADSIEQIDLNLQSLEAHKEFLQLNRKIKGENQSLTLGDLRDISQYYSEETKKLIFDIRKQSKHRQLLLKQKSNIEAQLQELKPKLFEVPYDVLVTVHSTQNQNISLQMTYQVKNAGWYSSYHMRAKGIDEDLELVHFANVFQNTGENWNNVILSFTNEDDAVSKNIPTLQPMYAPPNRSKPQNRNYRSTPSKHVGPIDHVTGYIYDETGLPIIGANVIIENTAQGTISNIDGYFELNLPPGSHKLVISYTGYGTQTVAVTVPNLSITLSEGELIDEIVITGYNSGLEIRKKEKPKPVHYSYALPGSKIEETNLNFSFIMDTPYTILSDAKNNEIALRQLNLEASFKYKAIPKLTSQVFLTAFVDDWEDKKLLRGNMNLYFEGAYIGKSLLDPSVLKDSMQISLGIDSNIKINRTRTKYYTKKKFIADKKNTEIIYTINLKNNKNSAIEIEIWDQIPVSVQKAIKVIPKSISADFNLNENNGIGYWNMTLPPKSQEELTIGFVLKYPQHYHFNF